MKATLEFDLNEPDDVMAHKRCVKSMELTMTVYDILAAIRSKLKYGELTDEQYDALEKLQTEVVSILEEHSVNVDELFR